MQLIVLNRLTALVGMRNMFYSQTPGDIFCFQVHKKDKKYKCMVCKKIFMLAASVGIRHGSRRYGVCVDCADSHQGSQEGLEGMQDLEFSRDEDFEEAGDEDMEAEGDEPNEIDQSKCAGDAGGTPEQD